MVDTQSTKQVQDILRLLVTVAGIVLGLMWGLLQLGSVPSVIPVVRAATCLLVISIFTSVLGLQFIVSETMKREKPENKNKTWQQSVAGEKRVAVNFLVAWVTFVGGLVTLGIAIYLVN